jgi:hypothetical protein
MKTKEKKNLIDLSKLCVEGKAPSAKRPTGMFKPAKSGEQIIKAEVKTSMCGLGLVAWLDNC